MNGRTIRKLLMRGRVGTFYGARALFVVRVPLSAIPEPVPPFKPLGEASYEGCWSRPNEDGTRTLFHIAEIQGFRDPTKRKRKEKDGFIPDLHHVRCDSSEVDEEGELHEDWSWFEGTETLVGPEPGGGQLAPVLGRRNLPAELVDAYVRKRRWANKYAYGPRAALGPVEETGLPWLDELHYAAGFARRFQPLLHANSMDLAYFVKWWHPRTKLWFCAAMHKALDVCKKAGVDVRVLRPPRRR